MNTTLQTLNTPVKGLYQVLIAWSLAPLAVLVVAFPTLSTALLVAWFAVVIALAIVGAQTRQSRFGPKGSKTAAVVILATAAAGYATATAWSIPLMVAIGAIAATVVTLVWFLSSIRRAA